jgi:Cu-Zn family superoxide dismutase
MSLVSRAGLAAALVLLAVGAAACADAGVPADAVGSRAEAVLVTPDGEAAGVVTLTQAHSGVLIAAEVRGIAPGPHGFHIHAVGACTPDFSAAADHFSPGGEAHGFFNPEGPHAGDLPNIHADADGLARADYYTDAITLAPDAAHSVFDEDGSAFIVHEKPDSYGADAGAGGRVACGVIERR